MRGWSQCQVVSAVQRDVGGGPGARERGCLAWRGKVSGAEWELPGRAGGEKGESTGAEGTAG